MVTYFKEFFILLERIIESKDKGETEEEGKKKKREKEKGKRKRIFTLQVHSPSSQ